MAKKVINPIFNIFLESNRRNPTLARLVIEETGQLHILKLNPVRLSSLCSLTEMICHPS